MKFWKHETFDAFANHLQTQYQICTCSGFPYKEERLVQCFTNGLDSNFDHVHMLLQNGALHWFTLNEVIQEVTEIK